ncbi:MAG: orotidine-5'-phosphate decarboxylase [Candidatus Sumerlaeales bacterium]|nr:orotidine-5'-phosphate decarboxylase [Candidatus Sumerlaeales bacterium]
METFNEKLNEAITKRQSNLCVGLDPDSERIAQYAATHVNGFSKELSRSALACLTVDKTFAYAVAYKPNAAFWETDLMSETMLINHIRSIKSSLGSTRPLLIFDGKRGDILNTSRQYAKNYLCKGKYDALTINPLMGSDGVLPFLEDPCYGAFVLCLTSNQSADEILLKNDLYLHIAEMAANKWNKNNNVGLVVGATRPQYINKVREVAPNLPLLIPGIGAQGGNLDELMDALDAKNNHNYIINVSRAIMFPTGGLSTISEEAKAYQKRTTTLI